MHFALPPSSRCRKRNTDCTVYILSLPLKLTAWCQAFTLEKHISGCTHCFCLIALSFKSDSPYQTWFPAGIWMDRLGNLRLWFPHPVTKIDFLHPKQPSSNGNSGHKCHNIRTPCDWLNFCHLRITSSYSLFQTTVTTCTPATCDYVPPCENILPNIEKNIIHIPEPVLKNEIPDV